MITLANWDYKSIVKNIVLVVLFSCGAIGCAVGAIYCASAGQSHLSGMIAGLVCTIVGDLLCILYLCVKVQFNNRYIPPIFIDEETNKLCFFTGSKIYEIEDQNYEITIVGKNKSGISPLLLLFRIISISEDVYGTLKIFLSNEKEQENFKFEINDVFLANEVCQKIAHLLSLRKDCFENKLDSLDAISKEFRLSRIADAIKEFDDITEKNSKQIFFME